MGKVPGKLTGKSVEVANTQSPPCDDQTTNFSSTETATCDNMSVDDEEEFVCKSTRKKSLALDGPPTKQTKNDIAMPKEIYKKPKHYTHSRQKANVKDVVTTLSQSESIGSNTQKNNSRCSHLDNIGSNTQKNNSICPHLDENKKQLTSGLKAHRTQEDKERQALDRINFLYRRLCTEKEEQDFYANPPTWTYERYPERERRSARLLGLRSYIHATSNNDGSCSLLQQSDKPMDLEKWCVEDSGPAPQNCGFQLEFGTDAEEETGFDEQIYTRRGCVTNIGGYSTDWQRGDYSKLKPNHDIIQRFDLYEENRADIDGDATRKCRKRHRRKRCVVTQPQEEFETVFDSQTAHPASKTEENCRKFQQSSLCRGETERESQVREQVEKMLPKRVIVRRPRDLQQVERDQRVHQRAVYEDGGNDSDSDDCFDRDRFHISRFRLQNKRIKDYLIKSSGTTPPPPQCLDAPLLGKDNFDAFDELESRPCEDELRQTKAVGRLSKSSLKKRKPSNVVTDGRFSDDSYMEDGLGNTSLMVVQGYDEDDVDDDFDRAEENDATQEEEDENDSEDAEDETDTYDIETDFVNAVETESKKGINGDKLKSTQEAKYREASLEDVVALNDLARSRNKSQNNEHLDISDKSSMSKNQHSRTNGQDRYRPNGDGTKQFRGDSHLIFSTHKSASNTSAVDRTMLKSGQQENHKRHWQHTNTSSPPKMSQVLPRSSRGDGLSKQCQRKNSKILISDGGNFGCIGEEIEIPVEHSGTTRILLVFCTPPSSPQDIGIPLKSSNKDTIVTPPKSHRDIVTPPKSHRDIVTPPISPRDIVTPPKSHRDSATPPKPPRDSATPPKPPPRDSVIPPISLKDNVTPPKPLRNSVTPPKSLRDVKSQNFTIIRTDAKPRKSDSGQQRRVAKLTPPKSPRDNVTPPKSPRDSATPPKSPRDSATPPKLPRNRKSDSGHQRRVAKLTRTDLQDKDPRFGHTAPIKHSSVSIPYIKLQRGSPPDEIDFVEDTEGWSSNIRRNTREILSLRPRSPCKFSPHRPCFHSEIKEDLGRQFGTPHVTHTRCNFDGFKPCRHSDSEDEYSISPCKLDLVDTNQQDENEVNNLKAGHQSYRYNSKTLEKNLGRRSPCAYNKYKPCFHEECLAPEDISGNIQRITNSPKGPKTMWNPYNCKFTPYKPCIHDEDLRVNKSLGLKASLRQDKCKILCPDFLNDSCQTPKASPCKFNRFKPCFCTKPIYNKDPHTLGKDNRVGGNRLAKATGDISDGADKQRSPKSSLKVVERKSMLQHKFSSNSKCESSEAGSQKIKRLQSPSASSTNEDGTNVQSPSDSNSLISRLSRAWFSSTQAQVAKFSPQPPVFVRPSQNLVVDDSSVDGPQSPPSIEQTTCTGKRKRSPSGRAHDGHVIAMSMVPPESHKASGKIKKKPGQPLKISKSWSKTGDTYDLDTSQISDIMDTHWSISSSCEGLNKSNHRTMTSECTGCHMEQYQLTKQLYQHLLPDDILVLTSNLHPLVPGNGNRQVERSTLENSDREVLSADALTKHFSDVSKGSQDTHQSNRRDQFVKEQSGLNQLTKGKPYTELCNSRSNKCLADHSQLANPALTTGNSIQQLRPEISLKCDYDFENKKTHKRGLKFKSYRSPGSPNKVLKTSMYQSSNKDDSKQRPHEVCKASGDHEGQSLANVLSQRSDLSNSVGQQNIVKNEKSFSTDGCVSNHNVLECARDKEITQKDTIHSDRQCPARRIQHNEITPDALPKWANEINVNVSRLIPYETLIDMLKSIPELGGGDQVDLKEDSSCCESLSDNDATSSSHLTYIDEGSRVCDTATALTVGANLTNAVCVEGDEANFCRGDDPLNQVALSARPLKGKQKTMVSDLETSYSVQSLDNQAVVKGTDFSCDVDHIKTNPKLEDHYTKANMRNGRLGKMIGIKKPLELTEEILSYHNINKLSEGGDRATCQDTQGQSSQVIVRGGRERCQHRKCFKNASLGDLELCLSREVLESPESDESLSVYDSGDDNDEDDSDKDADTCSSSLSN